MRRALRYLALLLTFVPLLSVCALGYLALSETGSRWLLQQAVAHVPGELRIASSGGRLAGGIVLRGVTYRQENVLELQAETIRLRWQPAALLHGTLHIEALHIQEVIYRDMAPAQAQETPLTIPERISVPLRIALEDASITDLRIETPDNRFDVDELNLSARAGPIRGLSVERFSVRTADSKALLTGATELHQPYEFSGRVEWSTRLPDAVEVQGSALLAGDIDQLQVDHTLTLPFHVTTEGSVRFDAETPVFRFAGQWRSLQWPLAGTALYASEQGDYGVDGTPDDYRFHLHGPVTGRDIPALLVEATGRGDRQQVRLAPLDIETLGGTLSGHGSIAWSPQFDLGLQVKASGIDPGRNWPDWPGRLHGTTQLALGMRDESIAVALSDIDLHGTLREYPVTARGNLTLRDGVPGSDKLVVGSGSNRLELAGVLDERKGIRYRVDAPQLAALLPRAGGALVAEGTLLGPVERPGGTIELTATGLSHGEHSAARLRIEAQLDRARPEQAGASVEGEDIRLGGAHIDTLKLDNRGWIEAHRTRLRLWSSYGDADVDVQGSYTGGSWRGRLGTATFDLGEQGSWALREAVELRITTDRIDPLRACWDSRQRELCLQGERRNDTLTVTLAGNASEGKLQADLEFAQMSAERPVLGGTISLDLPDISFLDPLVPDISVAAGAVTARASLAGYTDAPRVSGTAALEQGLVRIPELGLEVTEIAMRADADRDRVDLSGGARSGDGRLRFAGTARLDPARNWPFELGITGERFAIANLPEVDIVANPDLKIVGSSALVDLSGSVFIPYARIRLKRLPPNIVRVSADQVIVSPGDTTGDNGASTLPVRINVTTILGDDVHFEGLGLNTGLAGTLNVRSLRTRTLMSNGVLELVDGRYDGYGQKLAIQHGRLLFAGPLNRPALDIRATRTVGDVVAGIELSGNIDEPQTQLFSVPAMSDAETMSYLVTGKPLNRSSSGDDSQALAAAAASLGANSPVAQEISERLGIQVGVDSGVSDEDTAVVVGKQLSNRLYVDYVYGLFTESAAVQFVYKLTEHLSLAGQSGAEQSIDVRFGISRH